MNLYESIKSNLTENEKGIYSKIFYDISKMRDSYGFSYDVEERPVGVFTLEHPDTAHYVTINVNEGTYDVVVGNDEVTYPLELPKTTDEKLLKTYFIDLINESYLKSYEELNGEADRDTKKYFIKGV